MNKILMFTAITAVSCMSYAAGTDVEVKPDQPVRLFPLSSVRLLDGYFQDAVQANRAYLLAVEPDRLLAPFLREAGLKPKAESYGNWENIGLDGHTAGHYLSALAGMIAADADDDGELNRRLDYMLEELDRCQKAYGDGYIGGVPGSRELWNGIAAGNIELVWDKWVPWYNVHKTFAGLRDAYQETDKEKARKMLIGLGDWCVKVTADLSDEQMQQMLGNEYGGMNEVMADIYALTGDKKYLRTAERFNHRNLFDPLVKHEDHLTGLHANTQIPKVIGMERVAALTGNKDDHSGASFFWDTVTENRCIAFGGNSVSEHFNPVDDFSGLLKHREGPETCNTYNMLRLTEQLFAADPKGEYADFYERALYNHILASIDIRKPGYVYFTPIRPDHYRVYSQPENCFWCCVGTGMENPGRYGQFIYARADDGVYVNLFIPSVLRVAKGFSLRQETRFPYEPSTHLEMNLEKPSRFTLYLRHPTWVPAGELKIKVNGEALPADSEPSSYLEINREWKDGDTVDVELPMQISVEHLPDGSDWAALLYGPIVLASPGGTDRLDGLFANGGRMAHVANGPMLPLDQVPALLTTDQDLPGHIKIDSSSEPLHFRIKDVVEPKQPEGLRLEPFFSLHEQRYQMYFELTSSEKMLARKERLAAEERALAAREAATIDRVAVGEQQSEVEHDYEGSGTETGIYNGRRWRHGKTIQYTLDVRGEKSAELEVTYSGSDDGRTFDIYANGTKIATQHLTAEKRGEFIRKRYTIPETIAKASPDGRVTIRFAATQWLAGGLYDVRLMKPDNNDEE